MLAVYFALMICTALPVIALKAGISPEFLAWLVFGMVIVKSLLLVDHFMGDEKGATRVAVSRPTMGAGSDCCGCGISCDYVRVWFSGHTKIMRLASGKVSSTPDLEPLRGK
ncbi:MAG: cytochrome C oxidase subunit IV family protein [Marinobacter sp.]|nr:cytochrome C oxidase subunit IV family protein [Marinobacter sp.]